jgi:hypothetical protein
MGEVLYPEYRTYSNSRVAVNDAMMAILAGSRLGGHTLQLTVGSERTLSELFPAVEHIGRFNLRSDKAREFLENADHHLASVAIPYALAIHEHYIMSTIEMVRAEGISIRSGGKLIRAWNMHEVLFRSVGYSYPLEWMESFHVIRETRNCIVHAGGGSQQRLIDEINKMGTESVTGWQQLNAQRPADIVKAGRLELLAEHIFTAFAITKRLGREVNAALVQSLSKSYWARVAVEDFQGASSKPKNSSSWRRSLAGYVRRYYADAGLTEADLEQAARDLGLWTSRGWD